MEWSSTECLFRVLEAVRRNGPGSRSEVVDQTGLGRGAVAERISDLVDIGLLTESEVGLSTGGRPLVGSVFGPLPAGSSWPTSVRLASTWP